MARVGCALVVAGCAAEPVDDSCVAGDAWPWWCVPEGATGPSCGDVRFNPSCVDGTWRCPYPASLVPDREHRCVCFGGPRPATQHCACGDAGTTECTFDCGTAQCDLETEYCAVTTSDVGGEPDSRSCVPFALPCDGSGCGCVQPGSVSCEEDLGAVTAHYPGG